MNEKTSYKDIADYSALSKYLYAVSEWINGYTAKEQGIKIIEAYKQSNIANVVQNEQQQRYGQHRLCYRTIKFNNDTDMELHFDINAKIGNKYMLESYQGKAVFSWTTNENFAQEEGWDAPPFVTVEANIPTDMVLFAAPDIIIDDIIAIRAQPHLSRTEVIYFQNFLDAFEFFEQQREIIVWHQRPIEAVVIKIEHKDINYV